MAKACRQIEWRKKQKAKGRCVQCPNKARKGRVLCKACGALNNQRAASRRASNLTILDKARKDARLARRGDSAGTGVKARRGGCVKGCSGRCDHARK